MKKNLIYLFAAASIFSACNDTDETPSILKEKATFAVLSDIHYFDASLYDANPNADFDNYLTHDRKLIKESGAILDKVIATVMSEKPKFVLISGDLTKDGELVSHQQLALKLGKMVAAGIQVLVIPGNHDVNNPHARKFTNGTSEKITTVTAKDFENIYIQCGYGKAIQKHAESLSYLSEPVNGVWVICLDVCKYKNNQTLGAPETGGRMSESTLAWVKEIMVDAKGKNKQVLAMMHHGLVEHFAGQSALFAEYLVDDRNAIATALAETGLGVVFTGHFHANDVATTITDAGTITDVETGSTVTAPCPFRMVEIDPEFNQLAIQTRVVDQIQYPGIPSGVAFQEYAKQYVHSGIKLLAQEMLTVAPYNMPLAAITGYGIDQSMANAFIAHYAGDELIAQTDMAQIAQIQGLSPVLAGSIQAVWADLNPSDNTLNVSVRNEAWAK